MRLFPLPGLSVALSLVLQTSSPAQNTPALSSRDTFLAIDDSVFESVENMTLALYEARKFDGNPILKNRPEGPDAWRVGFPWVLIDGGKYRMWYLARDAAGEYFTCYAESSDGYTWQRPALGLFEHRGSKANNICYTGHSLFPAIYRDAETTDPQRRYIGVIYGVITKEHLNAQERARYGDAQPSIKCLAYSPDGLRWTEDHSTLFPIHAKVEGGTLLKVRDRWILVHQQNSGDYPQVQRHSRFITTSSSGDLKNWKLSDQPAFFFPPKFGGIIQTHVTPGYQNYGNVIVAAEGLFTDNAELIDHETDLMLILSNNGQSWRQPRPAQPLTYLLRRGQQNEWDRSFVVQGNLLNVGSKTLLYYNGSQWGNVDANGIQVGVAELRLDGYGSLAPKVGWSFGEQGPFEGTLVSKPIRLQQSGLKLYVNVRAGAAPGDRVQAELTDAKGAVLPGFSFADCENLNINSVGLPVAWKGHSDLSALAGKDVKVNLRVSAHNPERSGKIRASEPAIFGFYFDQPRLWLNREQRAFEAGLERQHFTGANQPFLSDVETFSGHAMTVRLIALDHDTATLLFSGNGPVSLRSKTLGDVRADGQVIESQDGEYRFEVTGVASLQARIVSSQSNR